MDLSNDLVGEVPSQHVFEFEVVSSLVLCLPILYQLLKLGGGLCLFELDFINDRRWFLTILLDHIDVFLVITRNLLVQDFLKLIPIGLCDQMLIVVFMHQFIPLELLNDFLRIVILVVGGQVDIR